ncbi:MAG: hypothetical protein ABW168_09155, partial [Sedimenticola sp.]
DAAYNKAVLLPLFLLVQVGIWLIYSEGFSALWMFDDKPNLQGLGLVNNFATALEYTFGGISSQIGRPLSLATFLIHAEAWPDDPAPFRQLSTLIHLCNGTLIALLAYLIARRHPAVKNSAVQIAVITAGLWLAHPLLASSVLSVVQRMTLLSATFMLAGLTTYVYGRSLSDRYPFRALALMTCGITFGTGLGILAKENAILLPALALVLEFTLLRSWPPTVSAKLMRLWQALFLLTPLLLLIGYLVVNWQNHANTYLFRSFSLSERLASEVIILWDYVRQIVLPDISQLGLFHDDTIAHTPTEPLVILAIFSWTTVITAACLLRKHAPIIPFAVFWFLTNHALESSALPLELYFEHRNYLAAIGPLAAIAVMTETVRSRLAKTIPLLALALLLASLWSVTSLWGNPMLAGEMWHRAHPASTRATHFIAQQYILSNDQATARELILNAASANPRASDLALQSIQLQCGFESEEKIRALYNDVLSRAQTLHASYAAHWTIHKLVTLVEEKSCPGMSRQMLMGLIGALLKNSRMTRSGLIQHHLHHALANLYLRSGDHARAIRHLDKAFTSKPTADTAILIAGTLAASGFIDTAIKSLDGAMNRAPRFHYRRIVWQQKFSKFKTDLATLNRGKKIHQE